MHKLRYSFLYFTLTLILILQGCSSDDEPIPQVIQEPLSEVHSYFIEIAFGSEFAGGFDYARKWNSDMKVYLPDTVYDYLNEELELIINELNPLLQGMQITQVDNRDEANYIIYFGDRFTYVNDFEPNATDYVASNWGLFYIYWDNWVINRGSMYVDVIRTLDRDCQKHLLREELTQSLGLMNDSYRYPDSMFYQEWTCGTSYSEIDRSLIELLYDPNIRAGMSKQEVIQYLRSLQESS